MPPKFVHGLRACCVAVALLTATARAAEPAQPSPIGLTLEQVLNKYGEPKSQIATGNRTVMFFARDRMVLRDGVVIEAEKLSTEPARRPAPVTAPPEAPPAVAAPAAAAPAAAATSAMATTPAPTRTDTATVVPAPSPVATVPPPAPAPTPVPEPKVEIKIVRPPSANYSRPNPQEPAAAAPTVAATTPPPSVVDSPPPKQKAETPKKAAPAPARDLATSPASRRNAERAAQSATAKDINASDTDASTKGDDAALDPVEEKKRKTAEARRKLMEADVGPNPDIGGAILNTQTILISLLVIGGGIGYLVWRSRQRQLELEATAVSNTPFSSPATAATPNGALFTAELLSRIEWKRFEELVAAYYSKTGVVAERTKRSADPVHIKIFWKGETRPFACVNCIAHPAGLVEVKPLQDLMAVLMAEDIRRGYVVTTGKFNVAARDFAEEKHLTLLPGDMFLEKLNALPDAARAEIMQTAATGDYQTPSCPKCDAKMVRSPDDPNVWRCATHPDQVIPNWS